MSTPARYMKICDEIASWSKATRAQVGAIIVRDQNIIAFGYNGTPPGFDNITEDEDNNTKPEVIHAEENAILKCSRLGIATDGGIMLCTYSPCMKCARMLIMTGITKIYFRKLYRDTEPLRLLNEYEIECIRIED